METYSSKKSAIIHVIIPLIIGGLIYIAFRSSSLRLFTWFEKIGFDNIISFIRTEAYPIKKHLPQWSYYSLPDGLWVYSFASALLILWDNNFNKVKFWLLIPLFLGTIIEIAQGLKIFPGTFDVVDLVFTAIGLILSVIIINHTSIQNEKTIS